MGRKRAPHKDIIKEVSAEVAAELNMNPQIVENAIRSEFQFVKHTLKSGKFRNVKLTFFGTFGVHKGQLERALQKRADIEANSWKPMERNSHDDHQ